MSDGGEELTVFEGGVLGRSQRILPVTALVGPATGNEFNAIVAGLVPIACFRVDNIRFAFGSSFIEPAIQPDLVRLGGLLRAHPAKSMAVKLGPDRPGAPISIFGHADPTGDDEFNKILSGRRAQAVHALMVRDANAWNELYTHSHGDDKWGISSIEKILAFLGRTGESPQTFDRDPAKRTALFQDYMNGLAGDALPTLERGDFLGGGKDAKGKGDFQGCGEFNPILVFSEKEQKAFETDKDKSGRDAANVPNRRVMVLIFREGSVIDPARWPCPRASEGSAGCRKRFWSDGEKRRTSRLPDAERRFELTHDTFACRFYHRISERSPCERVLKSFVLRVRLYSGFGKAIPNAPFSVTVQGREPTPVARADGKGVVAVPLRDVVSLSECNMSWGFPPAQGRPPDLFFNRRIFVIPDDDVSEEAAHRKLNNLGYEDDDRTQNVVAFQLDYGHLATPTLEVTGTLDQRTAALVHKIYGQAADELRNTALV